MAWRSDGTLLKPIYSSDDLSAKMATENRAMLLGFSESNIKLLHVLLFVTDAARTIGYPTRTWASVDNV
jgi:hypothetical protein